MLDAFYDVELLSFLCRYSWFNCYCFLSLVFTISDFVFFFFFFIWSQNKIQVTLFSTLKDSFYFYGFFFCFFFVFTFLFHHNAHARPTNKKKIERKTWTNNKVKWKMKVDSKSSGIEMNDHGIEMNEPHQTKFWWPL